MTRYYRSVAPAADAVTVEEVKRNLRVEHGEEDELIEALRDAAQVWLEGNGASRNGVLGKVLITQTWMVETREPNCFGVVWLDQGPVQSVTQVQVMRDGSYSTWSSSEWRLGYDGPRAFVIPKSGFGWPSRDGREDAIRITYVAGYGDAAADIPAPLRHAILLLAAELYENREASRADTGGRRELPFAVSALIEPFRDARI